MGAAISSMGGSVASDLETADPSQGGRIAKIAMFAAKLAVTGPAETEPYRPLQSQFFGAIPNELHFRSIELTWCTLTIGAFFAVSCCLRFRSPLVVAACVARIAGRGLGGAPARLLHAPRSSRSAHQSGFLHYQLWQQRSRHAQRLGRWRPLCSARPIVWKLEQYGLQSIGACAHRAQRLKSHRALPQRCAYRRGEQMTPNCIQKPPCNRF